MNTILFFILGACMGSFVPCFAERRQKKLSQWGRSYCMTCQQTVAMRDLIPILGYFFCRGHCRRCGTPIPKILPIFEGLSGCITALLALHFSPIAHVLLLLAGYSVMLLLSLDDWQDKTIHDSDLLLLFIILALDALLFGQHLWLSHIIGAVIVSAPLFMISYFWPYALGSGDALFMAIVGFYFGIPTVTYAFCLGILTALCYAIYLLAGKHASRSTALPLIPFLTLGTLLTIFLQ